MPSDGPYETPRFFDLTKDFIRKSDLEPEKKRDVFDSLYVFVRDEQDRANSGPWDLVRNLTFVAHSA